MEKITNTIAVAAGIIPAKALEAVVVTVEVEAVAGKVAAVVFDGCSKEDNVEPVDVPPILVVNILVVVVMDCGKGVIIGNVAAFVAAVTVVVDCPLQQVIMSTMICFTKLKKI